MTRRRKMPEVEDLDVDGLTMAAGRLADLSPAAFNDVLELAYAYLLVLGSDVRELARLGLITTGSGGRAAAMLVARAEAEGEASELAREVRS